MRNKNARSPSQRKRNYRSGQRKAWSKKEDFLLREWWGKIPSEEICKRLGRSFHSINLRRKRLGGFSTRDDEGYRIRDCETHFSIDHRQWHDFVARGWLRTYNLYGRSGITAVCVTVDAIHRLFREHPEIVDYAHALRETRTAFELWKLPSAPAFKRVVCQSGGWKDGERLTPAGFQVHHGSPAMRMKHHSFSLASCADLGGVTFWTRTYDNSPSCPRCGAKVSRYSPDATFSFEDPGNADTLRAVAGKVGLSYEGGAFRDREGHVLQDGEVLRYVFSTKSNPGRAIKTFRHLLAAGLGVAKAQAVDPTDLKSRIMRYRLTAAQQAILHQWLDSGALAPFLRPGSGKTVIAAEAMTIVPGRHALFVNTRTIAEHWVEHFERNAPAVQVRRLFKPNHIEITVRETSDGPVRCVIEVWSYMTRQDFDAKQYDVMCFDEVHHLPGNQAHRLSLVRSRYRLGLSASPHREDGRDDLLEHLAGKAVHDDWRGPNAAGLEIPRFPVKVLVVKDVAQKFEAVRTLLRRSGKTIVFSEGIADGHRLALDKASHSSTRGRSSDLPCSRPIGP